jgi:hypothetical protein
MVNFEQELGLNYESMPRGEQRKAFPIRRAQGFCNGKPYGKRKANSGRPHAYCQGIFQARYLENCDSYQSSSFVEHLALQAHRSELPNRMSSGGWYGKIIRFCGAVWFRKAELAQVLLDPSRQ